MKLRESLPLAEPLGALSRSARRAYLLTVRGVKERGAGGVRVCIEVGPWDGIGMGPPQDLPGVMSILSMFLKSRYKAYSNGQTVNRSIDYCVELDTRRQVRLWHLSRHLCERHRAATTAPATALCRRYAIP
eukprot:7386167-Prymnesium_polylepis.1